ncbi:MAG: fibrobacter succinogenes major paralogous domain-containing protein [Fibrobacter sp.]|nr:fibrobacter succinogenes major paralogous domain-containing protein [Fibrobacter sp.]
MNKKYLLAIAASTLMFVACGDDVTEVTEIRQEGMAVLEKGEKLSKQACDTTNVGEMLFVMDSSEAFICDGESWRTLKGEKGEDGEKGEKGDKGSKGDSGKDGSDGTSCTAKSVKNKAGLEGLEVTCGGAVVDTIWNGADGKDGDDGTNCSAKSVKNKSGLDGIEVTCGETVVDTIWNGADGKDGDDGTKCSAKSVKNKAKTRDGIEVTCGETVVDTIWNGAKGDNGEAGKSAYEIAKENGFEGTEAEWLESMKGPFIQDKRDGKIYKTVKIGNQVWMAENLNYSVNPGKQSWCYNDSAEYCEKYGRLYTWAAAMDSVAAFSNDGKGCGYSVECEPSETVRGICPEGWHLPDNTEWKTLFATVGGQNVAGKMLKSASGWKVNKESSGKGLDASGFSALPAGYRSSSGNFYDAGNYAYIWSVSAIFSGFAYIVDLYYNDVGAGQGHLDKSCGASVRCLKDN